MNITWLIGDINQVGGIEQVVCGLSNYFITSYGYGVKIVSLYSSKSQVFFDLNENAEIIHCGVDVYKNDKAELYKTVKNLFKTLDTDFVITCHPDISNFAVVNKIYLKKSKLIITEHCNPNMLTKKRILLDSLFFRFSDAFTTLTQDAKRIHKKYFLKARVMPNAMFNKNLVRSGLTEKTVVSVGRVEEVKGFDRLVKAFAIASEKYPEWKLCICGDGSKLNEIKELAAELGVTDRIILPGFVKNVNDYLNKASVFTLSSHYEGFSLVLIEALSSGLPVVAFDLPAIHEICEGKGALIAAQNDISSFASNLEKLFESDALLQAKAQEAFEVSRKYMLPVIAENWKNLFESLK